MHRIDPQGAQRAKPTSARLPKYLFLRGSTFYFKRRVPCGLEHAFPEARGGQLWKSPDTDLLSKAAIVLEAERAQFELRVAAACKEHADQRKRGLEAEAQSYWSTAIPPARMKGPSCHVCWRFARADAKPCALAGLWSDWTDPSTGELLLSYTLPTQHCDSHTVLSLKHKPDPDPSLPLGKQDKRTVVPLERADWEQWLKGSPEEALTLVRLPGTKHVHGPADPSAASSWRACCNSCDGARIAPLEPA